MIELVAFGPMVFASLDRYMEETSSELLLFRLAGLDYRRERRREQRRQRALKGWAKRRRAKK